MVFVTTTPLAIAQDWNVIGGVASRIEYNDNYFFTAPGQSTPGSPASTSEAVSGTTLSVIPFVAASRRTEVSQVTALLAIGANKVWGPSPSQDGISGTFELGGLLRDESSTWMGRASYGRAITRQNVIRDGGIIISPVYTDVARLEGAYGYALTDRWSLEATAGGYANRYDVLLEGLDDPSDDHGYNAGWNLRYAVSDSTYAVYSLDYVFYKSDPTRDNIVTTTVGVVHRYSPRLMVSASVGWYWSESTFRQDLSELPIPVSAGETRRDNGVLFGGSINWAVSESSRLNGNVSQALAPSAMGTFSRSDSAELSLSHRFSDRLTGQLGAIYQRTSFPAATNNSYSDRSIQGGVGLSYQVTERWKLDAGYQYVRTTYSQNIAEPQSNFVFISIGYNWPGATLTGWIGRPANIQVFPGAQPLQFPEPASGAPSDPSTSPAPEIVPFNLFTLP